MNFLAELEALWRHSTGDPQVGIAILDGPVDDTHPCFVGANLTTVETLVTGHQWVAHHGTHIASILFGQPGSPVRGVAPQCTGFILPVFQTAGTGLPTCSQIDLARAIYRAVELGAQIINISGGQLTPSGEADPILMKAVQFASENGSLIVAAAGNDGCECLHIPAALPSVLAVGAGNSLGQPLEMTNWGKTYQTQGILAPGEHILGAVPGGKTALNSGTSFATALVSGVAALLLSIQHRLGRRPEAHVVRQAILNSATPCQPSTTPDCRRFLAGSLNIRSALATIHKGGTTIVSEHQTPDDAIQFRGDSPAELSRSEPQPVSTFHQPPVITTSAGSLSLSGACGCQARGSQVYALGSLGYDLGSEARKDSLTQAMPGEDTPHNPNQLLHFLDKHPWEAASLIWTLNLDTTPIYAIQPNGPFAGVAYERLRSFLSHQVHQGVERISVPGILAGSVRLLSGQMVPVIVPEIRGMFSWTTAALVLAVLGETPNEDEELEEFNHKLRSLRNFLERIYFELRNLGVSPGERAINFAATNAFQIERVFERALNDDLELDTISVEKSQICRPDSDCWDVKLQFFDPEKQHQRARRVFRFTVDVSDLVPVTVGPVRSWSVY